MSAKIVVVGSYMHDLGLRVDRFPQPGETVMGRDRVVSAGGKGSNQAIQAARCGVPVAMVGATGNDAAGRTARQVWSAEGIDLTGCIERTEQPTGLAMILIAASGQNQIVIDPGANASLLPADVDTAEPLIAQADLVVAQLEVPDAAIIRAFRLARHHGVATLLNPAPARDLPDELWALTDYLVPNETEAAALAQTGEDSDIETMARLLLPRIAKAVIITAGERGAFAFGHDMAALHQPAPAVDVVDTTGAGDAFIGAFAAQWLQRRDLGDALRWGVAAGSLACGRRGVVPALAMGTAVAELVMTLPPA